MSEHMKDHEAWAEFGDVLRLPINPETDYVGGIPWEGAGFKPELPLVDIGPGSGLTTVALACLLYTSPSPRDLSTSRMPSSA